MPQTESRVLQVSLLLAGMTSHSVVQPCPHLMSYPCQKLPFPQDSRAAINSFPSVWVTSYHAPSSLRPCGPPRCPHRRMVHMEMFYTRVTKFANLLSCPPTCLSGAMPAPPKLWDKKWWCSLFWSTSGDKAGTVTLVTELSGNSTVPFSRTCSIIPLVFALCKIQIACGIFSEAS